MEDRWATADEQQALARTEEAKAEARLGQPWERADELARLRLRQQELHELFIASTSDDIECDPNAPAERLARPESVGGPGMAGILGKAGRPIAVADQITRIEGRLDALATRRSQSGLDISR